MSRHLRRLVALFLGREKGKIRGSVGVMISAQSPDNTRDDLGIREARSLSTPEHGPRPAPSLHNSSLCVRLHWQHPRQPNALTSRGSSTELPTTRNTHRNTLRASGIGALSRRVQGNAPGGWSIDRWCGLSVGSLFVCSDLAYLGYCSRSQTHSYGAEILKRVTQA